MRYESCVTSLSWIPSEAVTSGTRTAFDAGFTHYDNPPPDKLGDIEELRAADRRQRAGLYQRDVLPSIGELGRDRGPDHAAADDHDIRDARGHRVRSPAAIRRH